MRTGKIPSSMIPAMAASLLAVILLSTFLSSRRPTSLSSPSPEFFSEDSCLSKSDLSRYLRSPPPHSPSSYLTEKLRAYETLHRRCSPGTESYLVSVRLLAANSSIAAAAAAADCKYLIWSPFAGLGNRILSLVATFAYALLTDRVLLVHETDEFAGLFCQPFPGSNWTLPSDFPVTGLEKYEVDAEDSLGKMLQRGTIRISGAGAGDASPAWVYAHLMYNYPFGGGHRRFFCEESQKALEKVKWMLMKSDLYVAPSLFEIPMFAGELRRMFPERTTLFHHLARYLLHPSNEVWGMVTRYYDAYLAGADCIVGIQVRVFGIPQIDPPFPTDQYFNQIVDCVRRNGVLPPTDPSVTVMHSAGQANRTAVVVYSLHGEYADRLQSMYYEHPTVTEELVAVHQPTHEGAQRTEQQAHNQKALAEMILLSLSDKLVTSAGSTFGYVGYGLAGRKAWILANPRKRAPSDEACRRVESIDPCFHTPPYLDCGNDGGASGVVSRELPPFLQQCWDYPNGMKLVD